MTSTKYIGMDVHKESISIAVRNAAGKIVMECVIETKASMILQFIDGLRGDLQVTFEEGTWAAWLYDLLKPRVRKLVVCDPRRNALLQEGNQNDRIDAQPLLRGAKLRHQRKSRGPRGFLGGRLDWSLLPSLRAERQFVIIFPLKATEPLVKDLPICAVLTESDQRTETLTELWR
jgi:hypothetical protein